MNILAESIIDKLENFEKHEAFSSNCGICHNLTLILTNKEQRYIRGDFLHPQGQKTIKFSNWPEFRKDLYPYWIAGQEEYAVPIPEKRNLWIGPTGDARRRFLIWLISEIERKENLIG